jgi:hypothetical protein
VIPALFLRYDVYIISSPPESLLFTAWVLQKLGRKVIVDMRDAITRDNQYYRSLTGLWQWFYVRLQKVIVSSKVIDPTKPIIYHGYDEIEKSDRALYPPVYYSSQVNYRTYNLLLRYGFIRDFSGKPYGYGASSLHTISRLGYHANYIYSPDEYGKHTWQEGAAQFQNIISEYEKR